MGAFITAIITSRRNRKQPVGFRISILEVFNQDFGPAGLEAVLRVGRGAEAVEFQNLFLAEVEVVNRGNRDFPSFECGITVDPSDSVIYADAEGLDRHHQIRFDDPPSPRAPRHEVDVKFTPFNRGDSYKLVLHLVASDPEEGPGEIELGSGEPVVFRELNTIAALGFTAGLSRWLLKSLP